MVKKILLRNPSDVKRFVCRTIRAIEKQGDEALIENSGKISLLLGQFLRAHEMERIEKEKRASMLAEMGQEVTEDEDEPYEFAEEGPAKRSVKQQFIKELESRPALGAKAKALIESLRYGKLEERQVDLLTRICITSGHAEWAPQIIQELDKPLPIALPTAPAEIAETV
jgi:hypothetical protein